MSVLSDHNVTRATSRSTSGGRRRNVLRDEFGMEIVFGDPGRTSVFGKVEERVRAEDENDISPL
jgi:hypothetical protein